MIRGAWITLGLGVLGYLVFSFSARGVDADVLRSHGGIEVRDEPGLLAFLPPESAARAGVMFIPGGLVHPHADRLPAATKWVPIRGGNHSQFGYYGFQLGDRRARIPRAAQQAQLLAALLAALPDTLRGGSP